MNSRRKSMLALSLIVLLVVLVVVVIVTRKKPHCENYNKCFCTRGDRYCQSVEDAQIMYNSGLNENSDWAARQIAIGGPHWSDVNPGDLNYPPSYGCGRDCDAADKARMVPRSWGEDNGQENNDQKDQDNDQENYSYERNQKLGYGEMTLSKENYSIEQQAHEYDYADFQPARDDQQDPGGLDGVM